MGIRLSNNGVNLTVRPVTALANGASAAPVRPAGYAGRYAFYPESNAFHDALL